MILFGHSFYSFIMFCRRQTQQKSQPRIPRRLQSQQHRFNRQLTPLEWQSLKISTMTQTIQHGEWRKMETLFVTRKQALWCKSPRACIAIQWKMSGAMEYKPEAVTLWKWMTSQCWAGANSNFQRVNYAFVWAPMEAFRENGHPPTACVDQTMGKTLISVSKL